MFYYIYVLWVVSIISGTPHTQKKKRSLYNLNANILDVIKYIINEMLVSIKSALNKSTR